MLAAFQHHLQQHFPFLSQKKLILTISGGIDSVVLAHLLHELELPFMMAHCNFQLRGEESEGDQRFVEALSRELSVPLVTKRFETKAYGKAQGLNTQLAARVLRYEWFEALRQEQGYDYILTAHQANDSWETFLINTSRGTGLKGLLGIPTRNGAILRPLLPFSREEILAFATERALCWREDSSNSSDAYTRNKIRHHLSPILKEVHPLFFKNFEKTQALLQLTYDFLQESIARYRQECFVEGEPTIFLIEKLRLHPHRRFLLHELLSPYGFDVESLERFLQADTGKYLASDTHRLLSNRGQWLISRLREVAPTAFYLQAETGEINHPIALCWQQVDEVEASGAGCLYVDRDKVQFPLCLRKRKEGDLFYPYGMGGQKKTLRKYFKDEKYTMYDKENQWLLTDSTDQILWVIGKRADERFRPSPHTQYILCIKLK
jgi:tRNA(ile)-lysidine synthetase